MTVSELIRQLEHIPNKELPVLMTEQESRGSLYPWDITYVVYCDKFVELTYTDSNPATCWKDQEND